MKTNKLLIASVTATLVLQLSACEYKEALAAGGALVGGLAGTLVKDDRLKPLAIVAGTAIGGLLGNRLGDFLDKQDMKKLQEQVNVQVEKPQAEISVACAGEEGNYRSVSMQQAKSLSCGDKNKVILSTSANKSIAGEQCKDLKTEVMGTQGTLETVNMKSCKDSNGVWHEKSA